MLDKHINRKTDNICTSQAPFGAKKKVKSEMTMHYTTSVFLPSTAALSVFGVIKNEKNHIFYFIIRQIIILHSY